MNITTILDESLRIEYKELDKFLARYDLTSDEKLAVYQFHSKASKKNKGLVVSEQKDESYK